MIAMSFSSRRVSGEGLREQLSGDEGGIIAEMVLQSPGDTVALIHKIVANLRKRRTVSAPPATPLAPHLRAFHDATDAFADFIQSAPAVEEGLRNEPRVSEASG